MEKQKLTFLKIFRIIFIIFITLSNLILIYSLLLLNKIELFYLICGIIFSIYISTILIFSINKSLYHYRKKRFYTSIIISFIYVLICLIISYLILVVYKKLDSFSKDKITYKTSLITYDDKYKDISSLKNLKIGLVKDEKDYELFILPKEYIESEKLDESNEIIEYSSLIELMNDLFDKKIEVGFVNANYKDLLYSLEEFSNLDELVIIKSFEKEIDKNKEIKEEKQVISKALTEPFTMLLLGVDSTTDGLDKNAAFNGDTIMLITFNPETLNATMFSVPRDTYVKIACGNRQMQKVNTSAYGGATCVMNTLKNMTGINIDYYAKINFKGVTDLVDALGGIEVDVPYKFCEQNSNREFGEYTIYLERGFQKLNGEEALALARNRKGHPESCSKEWNTDGVRNDFVRGQNQQLVVSGMLNQIKNINSANKFLEILDIISKNIDTNMTTDQMLSFYEVAKNILLSGNTDIINIQKTLLTGYDMNVAESYGIRYAFFNWKGSLDDIVDEMKINLNIKEAPIIKTFAASINEPYEVKTVGVGNYKESKLELIPDFSTYSTSQIKSWASSHGKTIKFIDADTNKEIIDFSGYSYISQSALVRSLVIKSDNTINITMKNKGKKAEEQETSKTEEVEELEEENIDTEN